MRSRTSLAAVGWAALVAAGPAHAYQAVQVPWPGMVKANVRVVGALPAAPAPTVSDVDVPACGAERPSSWPSVTPDGKLGGALVYIENIAQGRPLPRRQVPLDVRNCVLPSLYLLAVGDELQLGSVDSVAHQLALGFEPDGGGAAENWGTLALVPGGQRPRFKLPNPGWVVVKGRGAHAWIGSRMRVFDHPYHQLTGADGVIDIRDVPPGTYNVHAWHPNFGSQVRVAEVKSGYNARLDFEFAAAAFKPGGVPPPGPPGSTPPSAPAAPAPR